MKHLTTRWENVKNRIKFLMEADGLVGGFSAALGVAICEELDRLDQVEGREKCQ